MRLLEALAPLLPARSGAVIALVGAGGKTSALFALGEELAARAPVLLTTTTHLSDPRLEPDRRLDRLRLESGWEEPPADPAWTDSGPGGARLVVLAARGAGAGKLKGIHPQRVPGLARAWAYVLVEADGAKRLPVKAPADHEPVWPPAPDLVLGLIGLGCLGQPMDAEHVHRPERFGPLAGCAPGAPIGLGHLAALAGSPQGLFKGAPDGARRVLLLNQADRCALAPGILLAPFLDRTAAGPERVLLCALHDPSPEARVRVVALLK